MPEDIGGVRRENDSSVFDNSFSIFENKNSVSKILFKDDDDANDDPDYQLFKSIANEIPIQAKYEEKKENAEEEEDRKRKQEKKQEKVEEEKEMAVEPEKENINFCLWEENEEMNNEEDEEELNKALTKEYDDIFNKKKEVLDKINDIKERLDVQMTTPTSSVLEIENPVLRVRPPQGGRLERYDLDQHAILGTLNFANNYIKFLEKSEKEIEKRLEKANDSMLGRKRKEPENKKKK
jgi:hypothetical protein